MARSRPNSTTDEESQKEEGVQIYEPEPPNSEEIVVKRCECPNCKHYTTGGGWCTTPSLQCEPRLNKVQTEKIVQPILKSAQNSEKSTKIISYSDSISSEIEKESAFKTLVHGVFIPKPVSKCEETSFHEDVQVALKNLRYEHTKPIQSFVWPAIFRGMNVFMISGPKSGKTMAYLPAICTYAFHSEYKQFDKYKGPLAVIVCPNSKQCEEIYDLIKTLYRKIPIKSKVSIMTYPIMNTNNMDLLITIPDVLVHCIKSRVFHLKRLCHLVFENTSVLLKNNEDNINTILKVANEMLEHRSNDIQLRLIVSSEKWTSDMLKLLKSLHVTPLVCIGNHLEAALYGGIKFDIRFLVSQHKQSRVEELLRDKYGVYKTLIICQDEEVTELNKYLVRKGIETLALRDASSKEDIEASNYEWASAPSGMYKVLLCTDYILGAQTSINDAVWVIHYSFAKSWERFCERFSTQSLNYKSPLTETDDKIQCRSYVLIDETCKKYMPKIINLLRRLTKDFPKSYQEYAKSCNLEIEQAKIDSKTELCKTLKLFGRCPDSFCQKRHLLTEDLDTSSDFPKNGKIVFKILNLEDVTHYFVQLLKHIDLDGRVSIINDDNLKEPLQYEHKLKKRAEPQEIKPGDFYIQRKHTTGSPEYRFCQVLTVVDDTFVEIKLLNGVIAQVLKTNLFEPPEDLKIAEVYMSNLIPPHRDDHFSGRSYHVTRTSLESKEYKDIVLTADIQLQLNNTFWVANVAEMAQFGDSSLVKFNFSKNLKDLRVVNVSKTQLADLYKLCATCGINLPAYEKVSVKKAIKAKEVECQTAFLNEGPNEVFLISAISPEEFYVVLRKYQDLLKNLEEDIQKAVRSEILDKDVKAVVGRHYLALDPLGKAYARALILNIQDDKALIFYVDYGDEAVVDVSSLKNLPSKFITRLPFQAIQCRLHGLSPAFGEWEDEATDVLYKYMFEPDSDIYRSLFVQVCEKEKSSSIRSKFMHSVLLKDGFGDQNCLINQLIIDCDFATSIFGKIDDFELPQRENTRNSADSDFEISENENEDVVDELLEFSEEDMEIMNGPEFLEMFCPIHVRNDVQNQIKQITYESKKRERQDDETIQAEVQASTSAEGTIEEPSGKLTPEVYWSQRDNVIRLKIKLAGVTDYKANLVHRRIFMFWTKLDEKIYELKFTLHQIVEMGKHCAKGQEVVVVLNKVQPLEWTQLTNASKRSRNVHYEFPDHEKPKPRKKLLQLDVEDAESEPEEMYHESSDLDSDFDKDVVSSSED